MSLRATVLEVHNSRLTTKHMGHLPSAGASDNHALNARCQALLLVIVPTACAAPRLLTVDTVVQQGELRSLLSPHLEFSLKW